MMRSILTLIALSVFAIQAHAQLIINEVSQGPSGAKEYVELLVIGNPTCASSTVDLRGWIIDDNNGWHATGSGTGIAPGHVRFANIPQWANIKIGTLILVYNDADVSTTTAALTADETDANADCRYILPISSTTLEKNNTVPNTASDVYTGATYTTTGTWTPLGMANGGDAFHTVSPANLTTPYFSIGWGNNTALTNVYYSGGQGGNVIYMANTVDNDPFNSANYTEALASTSETPGAPNNIANAAWISSLNNNCQHFVQPTTTRNLSLCPGQSVVIGSTTVTTAGSYIDTIPATIGCDTIRTTQVTISPYNTDAQSLTFCQGQSTVINGQTITTSGSYTDTIPGTVGCDTIRTYNVTFTPYNTANRNISLCPGQSTVINGQTVSTAGNYLDTIPSTNGGCDTVITYTVSTVSYQTSTQNVSICNGQSIVINGQTVTAPGTYFDTIPSTSSCDTIVAYQVTQSSYIMASQNISLCNGQSVVINGQTITAPGTYFDTIPTTTTGCDTAYSYIVTLGGYVQQNRNVQICSGQSIVINGQTITAPGTYIDTIPTTTTGCDSIITTNLTVHQPDNTTQNISVCTGETVQGQPIYNDTTFSATLTNQYGCDSTITYTVTALPLPTVTVSDSVQIMEGETATISASGGTDYLWSTNQTNSQITVTPPATQYYYVTVSDINNCSVSDSVLVDVTPIPELEILVPTGFSPNGDGINDYFDIVNRNLFDVQTFNIYNRWGELVFNDPNGKWDGTYKGVKQPIGTYVFYVQARNIAHTKQYTLKGNVTLLR
jgi:gliding motility-associated-like protein